MGSAAAHAEGLPVAFNGKIAGDDATSRFFIDFDKNLRLKTFYMDEPYRIIIDLEEVTFDFGEADKPEPRGLVTAIQYGRISKGRSRIVLTLSQPVEIIKASMQQRLDENHFRFLLDFDSADDVIFNALLDQQGRELGESGAVAIKGDRIKRTEKPKVPGKFTVVIDPGHGGIDGGAIGRATRVKEKDIVLSVARKLKSNLEQNGPYDVLLTREGDEFVSLKERLSFSRRSQADLFISLHADSLNQRFVRGATVYSLSKKASDKLSERLAESENSVDLLAGLSVTSDADAVSDILVDLTTRETKNFSRTFSRLLVAELDGKIKLIKNPQRSAAFGVLKAPDVPGVLVELGYLSNREDEKLLSTTEWQDKAATAIANAVNAFFDARTQN